MTDPPQESGEPSRAVLLGTLWDDGNVLYLLLLGGHHEPCVAWNGAGATKGLNFPFYFIFNNLNLNSHLGYYDYHIA